jgi:hypothetical protein
METTGNSSFLIVLKSRTGSTTAKLLSAASTIDGVGHSMAARITGRTSIASVSVTPSSSGSSR